MEVMCEQLQNILYTFQQQQAVEKETTDRAHVDCSEKSANLNGVTTTARFSCFIFWWFKMS